MKKIYTLVAGLLLIGGTINAQTLVNGDFEAAITEILPSNPGKVSSTAGWGFGLYSKVVASPGEGAQSVSLKTIVDAAIATQLQLSNDTIGGQIFQELNGPVSNPATLTVDFMYKYTPVMGDVAVFVVEIYDTLAAGLSDDKLLYQGVSIMSAAKTAWTNNTVTLDLVEAGTPNQIVLIASGSAKSLFTTTASLPAQREGSELFLDKVEIKNTTVGVNENTMANASVYPNPATDLLNFKLDGVEASSITIFSLDGKTLISQSVNSTTGSVNVSELNSGMYIYQIATANGETVKSTFVKK